MSREYFKQVRDRFIQVRQNKEQDLEQVLQQRVRENREAVKEAGGNCANCKYSYPKPLGLLRCSAKDKNIKPYNFCSEWREIRKEK